MLSDKFYRIFGQSCNFASNLGAMPFHWKKIKGSRGTLITTSKSIAQFKFWALGTLVAVVFLVVQIIRLLVNQQGHTVSFYFLYAIFLCALFLETIMIHMLWRKDEILVYLNAWPKFLDNIQSKLI